MDFFLGLMENINTNNCFSKLIIGSESVQFHRIEYNSQRPLYFICRYWFRYYWKFDARKETYRLVLQT